MTTTQTISNIGSTKGKNGRTEYYRCNFKVMTTRSCISFATVQFKTNGKVIVSYNFIHSHLPKWDQIKVPLRIKRGMCNKIIDDVPIIKLQRKLLNTIDVEQGIVSKIQTISSNYLNYLKTYIRTLKQYDKNDYISVKKMIDSLEKDQLIRIICYKQYTDKIVGTELTDEDFILAFSTDFLLNEMQEYNQNGISFDATHSTNKYLFPLTIGFGINAKQTSFPFIFMISSRETENVMKYVFSCLARNINNGIDIPYIMSDITDIYYNSWIFAFGKHTTKQLYCYFHLVKAWNNHLNMIKETPIRCIIKEYLFLLVTSTKHNYQYILNNFMEYIEISDPTFYGYFKSNYSKNIHKWALFGREDSIWNTNNFAESYFKKMKYGYLDREAKNRLDYLIETILTQNQTEIRQEIVKADSSKKEYEGYRYGKSVINHKKSMKLISDEFNQINDSKWRYKNYTIIIVPNKEKKTNSSSACNICTLKFNDFRCTCLNFLLKKEICKHIHFVANNFTTNVNQQENYTVQRQHHSRPVMLHKTFLGQTDYTNTSSKANGWTQDCILKIDNLLNDEYIQDVSDEIKTTPNDIKQTIRANGIEHIPITKDNFTPIKSVKCNNTKTIPQELLGIKKEKDSETIEFVKLYKKRGRRKFKTKVYETFICRICYKPDNLGMKHKNTILNKNLYENEGSAYLDWVACDQCDDWFHLSCLNYVDTQKKLLCSMHA
eukprot:GAHX01001294.1.p1 GENE.GAHX01001294.1~~GAHX01001294.1.p1  ORF type:complete len:717 (-),score=92.13 GAHX01001294.1:35-2185(-)